MRESLKSRVETPSLREFEQFSFGIFDMALRRRVNWRFVGEVHHILADGNQVATNRQVVNGTAVVLGVDNGRGLGSKPRQILIDRKPGDIEVARQERLERDRRRQLASAYKAAGELENALV